MGTFINLELGNPTPPVYRKRHLFFILIWTLNIGIFVFRVDTNLSTLFNTNLQLINLLIPVLTIMIDFYYCTQQKWYYNLALLFYPLLIVFWFLPKFVLEKGKIYLLLYYLSSIAIYFTNFKKSLILSTIFLFVCMFLLTTDNKYVRITAVIYFTYLFFKIFYIYVTGSYKVVNKQKIKTNSSSTFSKLNLVETIENQKDDEKLTPEQNSQKKIKSIILWNFFLQYISNNVNSSRGKRAFSIVWFFQYFLYVSFTISFFTFLNYQLFKIDPSNYSFHSIPNIFDFFYYTIKSAVNGSVDYLKPVSAIARVIDICCFAIVTVYFFIITISSIYSLKMSEYNQDMQVAVNACQIQNDKIIEHLKIKYNTDISKAICEFEAINNSINKLKEILERIL